MIRKQLYIPKSCADGPGKVPAPRAQHTNGLLVSRRPHLSGIPRACKTFQLTEWSAGNHKRAVVIADGFQKVLHPHRALTGSGGASCRRTPRVFHKELTRSLHSDSGGRKPAPSAVHKPHSRPELHIGSVAGIKTNVSCMLFFQLNVALFRNTREPPRCLQTAGGPGLGSCTWILCEGKSVLSHGVGATPQPPSLITS